MNEEIEAFPLAWPQGRPRKRFRNSAKFDAEVSIGRTRDELLHELTRFRASHVVISSNLQLRLDGLLRANQPQPQDPGVAVYFRLNNVPHAIACDAYTKVQHNLRAIAKTIEAQRGILRWGAVTAEQVFAGFKQLPPPSASAVDAPLTLEAAAEFVSFGTGSAYTKTELIGRVQKYREAYRILVKAMHPDAGGLPQQWEKLQAADKLLRQHHKM